MSRRASNNQGKPWVEAVLQDKKIIVIYISVYNYAVILAEFKFY